MSKLTERLPSLVGKKIDFKIKDGIIDLDINNLFVGLLDKQKVREAITKACKIRHFNGLSVIAIKEERTKSHDILEELWKELGLG